MDGRSTRLIAALGCGALLLLIVLPIALVLWAFGGNFDLTELAGRMETPQVQTVPERNAPPAEPLPRQTTLPDEAQGATQQPQSQESVPIPQTGEEGAQAQSQQLELAEPVSQTPETLADLYEQVSPGTVSILVSAGAGGQLSQQGGGAGSGFVLTEDGYIVTNDHVVEGGDQVIVRFFNDVDLAADVVGVDPDSDLAVLRVAELPDGVYPLPMGDSNNIRVGDGVVAIGNPFAIGTSMSYGIISAVGRTIPSMGQYQIPQAIQTDAAINPGNSGGPLINMRGEVIGVNAQIRTTGQGGGNIGIGFAIPVNIVRMISPSLIENGRYQWPYLGVGTPNISPFAQEPGGAEAQRGALIGEVTSGGPAASAGIRPGDIVIRADDQTINNFNDLLTFIAFQQPGDEVVFTILRGGQEQQVTATLGARPVGVLQ